MLESTPRAIITFFHRRKCAIDDLCVVKQGAISDLIRKGLDFYFEQRFHALHQENGRPHPSMAGEQIDFALWIEAVAQRLGERLAIGEQDIGLRRRLDRGDVERAGQVAIVGAAHLQHHPTLFVDGTAHRDNARVAVADDVDSFQGLRRAEGGAVGLFRIDEKDRAEHRHDVVDFENRLSRFGGVDLCHRHEIAIGRRPFAGLRLIALLLRIGSRIDIGEFGDDGDFAERRGLACDFPGTGAGGTEKVAYAPVILFGDGAAGASSRMSKLLPSNSPSSSRLMTR